MHIDDAHVGRRVREIRNWRGLSLTAAAGLAGMSQPYLSMIERGLRPVSKRSTLEALARALRVSPAELTGGPFAPVDSVDNEAHAGTEWLGFASFVRGFAGSGAHLYELSVRAAELLQNGPAGPNELQVAGALQLNAALAAAATGNAQQAREHLTEAADVANHLPDDRDNFGYLYIGPEQVGVWRVSLGTELGEGAKVAEYARDVDPDRFPGKARHAAFLADLGRSLANDKVTRARGIQTLVEAEQIAPQLIRNNVFVRETVGDLLRQVRRDSGGRELRGLAWRMGIAPTG